MVKDTATGSATDCLWHFRTSPSLRPLAGGKGKNSYSEDCWSVPVPRTCVLALVHAFISPGNCVG